MKFTLPLTILAVAVSVDAAAVMEQDKRYCHAEGQACDTVKRAAAAFSDAIKSNLNLATRSESGGETTTIAARQIHELALAIAASHDDPAKFFNSLGFHSAQKREADPGWCDQFIGMPCWKRDAEPNPGWCDQFIGMPCWKRDETTSVAVKRDAEPGWCDQFIGMPCWKRDAEPGWCDQFIGMPCWKRDAQPAAEPDRFCTRFTGSSCWKRDGSAAASEEAKRCVEEGGACWQAKRAAAAVINTIDQGNALKMARDADPGWCDQFIGMPCWKRSETCNGPAGVCTKATRDLHAMYNAARSIIEA